MSSIKISQLDPISSINSVDFFPLDQSSSLTTKRGSVNQLQTYLSTGSFSGSFVGVLTGTASWAQKSISSSYATASTSASYALTASYASNAGTSGIGGSGTVNYATLWATSTTLKDSELSTDGATYTLTGRNFTVSGGNFTVNQGSQTYISSIAGGTNANFLLQSSYSASDAWVFTVGTGNSGIDTSRGALDLSTYSSSNQLISKQGNSPDAYGTVRAMRIVGNGIYIWPLGGAQSISRDGTFNVGVDSGTANTSTRLLIDVYSGSSVSNPQTYHLQKAIEVRYGSSSLNTTFCVSSSGYVYATGYNVISSSNYAYTSSLASGSFAVIEDNGVMFLFARSANGKLRSASLA